MSKRKLERGLLAEYRWFIIAPIATITIIIGVAIGLITAYGFEKQRIHLIILAVITGVSVFIYILNYIYFVRRLHHNYYDQMFSITYENIRKIKNNDSNLTLYDRNSTIREIRLLNEATADIKEKLTSAYLVAKDPDYSNLSLEYVDKNKRLITYNSFKSNLQNIIFVSMSFRNIIIEAYFNLPHHFVMSDKDKERLLKLYTDAFKEHQNALFAFSDDNRSLLIYLPVIDSFSEIKERLEILVSNSSLMVRDERGLRNVPAQYALVAYPYSNIDMLLGDLKYAKRQNKPYFLYLPNRFKVDENQKIIPNSSMNLSYMTKALNELSKLDYFSLDNERNIKVLKNALNTISDYLGIDDAGIISLNEMEKKYHLYTHSDRSTLFINKEISPSLIKALDDATDEDQTYYFSSRSHANYCLEREIDLRGITSGVYYVMKSIQTGEIKQIIYFFNRGKDLTLNSYLRETIYMLSLRIAAFFEKKEIADYADKKDDENENILALTNIYLYRVDHEYRILHHSRNMKKIFPKAKVGEYCYKAFFNADKPCRDCPLRTYRSKGFKANEKPYEASSALSDREMPFSTIVIRNVGTEEERDDLFQNDLLVYSYRALVDAIRQEYYAISRGYLLLLRIDNYDSLVSRRGSEAYNFVIRNYTRKIRNKLNIDDIYFYNPTTLALHLPNKGHADVINIIESIYALSKEPNYGEKDFVLNISYLPLGYPRGYASAEDFLKHCSDFYRSPTNERNKDFIYFADFSIARSANKHDFMVSVLESEFSSKSSTSMNMQPIVRAKDGHIFGAEILLRINDTHRNVFFNAFEISKIAEEENLTHLITESTINFIGNLYKEYGKGIFKTNEFNRMAINIDQTYLKDQTLISNIIKLSEENNLPNDFISLEIPEDIIARNFNGIKELANKLKGYKIMFSCDRYLGEYVTVEQLKELGIDEIKVARDIILKIDKDPTIYQNLTKTVNEAKEKHMRIAAVGVETEQQFRMLKALDEEMMVQGYYFYKPLSRSDFIAALVSYDK